MASLAGRSARPTFVAAPQGAGCPRSLRCSFLGGSNSWEMRRSVAAPCQQRRWQRQSPPPTVAGEPVWRGDKDVLKEDRLKLFRTVRMHSTACSLALLHACSQACCDSTASAGWRTPSHACRQHSFPSRLPRPARCTTSKPGPRTAAPSATCGTSWVG